MKKLMTIIGARPQIIKAAAVSRAIRNSFSEALEETIIHTGQHYDASMSQVFFDEMGIPHPSENLGVGSHSHTEQTARMMTGIEKCVGKQRPDALLVYGDTNSTLAAALVGVKMSVPIIHVEAGLRSFNKKMPEEINRITCDHSSTFLFVPTHAGIANLQREGFDVDYRGAFSPDHPGVFHCGDVMYDNALYFSTNNSSSKDGLENLGVAGDFILCTVHRDSATDFPEQLGALWAALMRLADDTRMTIVIPLHPRTLHAMRSGLSDEMRDAVLQHKGLKIIEPVSYFQMLALEKNCRLVVTDSGGVQKEAYFFKKPCVILREQTEWVELVENGNAKLAGTNQEKILDASNELLRRSDYSWPSLFGTGHAAEFMCQTLVDHLH